MPDGAERDALTGAGRTARGRKHSEALAKIRSRTWYSQAQASGNTRGVFSCTWRRAAARWRHRAQARRRRPPCAGRSAPRTRKATRAGWRRRARTTQKKPSALEPGQHTLAKEGGRLRMLVMKNWAADTEETGRHAERQTMRRKGAGIEQNHQWDTKAKFRHNI